MKGVYQLVLTHKTFFHCWIKNKMVRQIFAYGNVGNISQKNMNYTCNKKRHENGAFFFLQNEDKQFSFSLFNWILFFEWKCQFDLRILTHMAYYFRPKKVNINEEHVIIIVQTCTFDSSGWKPTSENFLFYYAYEKHMSNYLSASK